MAPPVDPVTTPDGDNDLPHRDGHGQFVKSVESVERDAEALRLKGRGVSLQRISDQLGYGDKGNVSRAVTRAVAAVQAPAVREYVEQQLDTLDDLTRAALAVLEREHVMISDGRIVYDGPRPPDGEVDTRPAVTDDGPVLAAIDRMLRIADRRSRLLGLDTPTKSEATVSVDVSSEVAALVERARVARAGEGP